MQTNNNDNQGMDRRGDQHDMNENTGNLGSQNQQNTGSRGNEMDDEWGNSTQRGHESDGPRMAGRDIDEDYGGNFSSSAPEGNINPQASERGEFNEDNLSEMERRDASEAQSRTFEEDEESWEGRQQTGSSFSNRGSENNDWNQNDQMQRSPGRGDSEENRDFQSGSYYNEREEDKGRSSNSTRNNSGDDF